jgi:hypothetical protein
MQHKANAKRANGLPVACKVLDTTALDLTLLVTALLAEF